MINYIYQLVNPQFFSVKYEDANIDGKVLIRPRYMSICHADQRYYLGNRDMRALSEKLPMALIHECCGEVILDKTGTYEVGQNVVLIPNTPTRACGGIYENYDENLTLCQAAQTALCVNSWTCRPTGLSRLKTSRFRPRLSVSFERRGPRNQPDGRGGT